MNLFKKRKIKKKIGTLINKIDDLDSYIQPLFNYQSKYTNELQEMWTNLVPSEGNAESIQGELLLRIEALRYEAQNNGNINWDNRFEDYCDFICEILLSEEALKEWHVQIIQVMLKLISHGQYAHIVQTEDIPTKLFDPMKVAYVEDSLYNFIGDIIVLFCKSNPELIPFYSNFSYTMQEEYGLSEIINKELIDESIERLLESIPKKREFFVLTNEINGHFIQCVFQNNNWQVEFSKGDEIIFRLSSINQPNKYFYDFLEGVEIDLSQWEKLTLDQL